MSSATKNYAVSHSATCLPPPVASWVVCLTAEGQGFYYKCFSNEFRTSDPLSESALTVRLSPIIPALFGSIPGKWVFGYGPLVLPDFKSGAGLNVAIYTGIEITAKMI